MMGSDFYFRDKIPVTILGATGCVGQKFIQLLEHHPWFQVVAVCASERSVGKLYREAVNWLLPTPIPENVASMKIQPCQASVSSSLVFSGLDASVAGSVEMEFAQAGCMVVSNARNHRMDPTVPLVVGEINPDHLNLLKSQQYGKGKIVTNPNCSVIGLTLALKPLIDRFGIEAIHVVTLQAISGAGYPGVASLDILDNVIPYIGGEEEKIEQEPLKILGQLENSSIQQAKLIISAQCNRVPVIEGHTECVSIKLKSAATEDALIRTWREFIGEPQHLALPTAPLHPLYYIEQKEGPQPRLHCSLDKGMAVAIGRLRRCPLLDYKFTLLSHNTIRGAAGSAILNGELLVKKGWIYW